MQRDPALDGVNVYGYGNSEPMSMVDPSGLVTFRGGGCSNTEQQLVNRAVQDIKRVYRSCLSQGDQDCIEERLQNGQVECNTCLCNLQNRDPGKNTYGYFIGGHAIALCAPAFYGGKMLQPFWYVGCIFSLWTAKAPEQQPGLAYTVLHELLHSCGHRNEADVRRRAERCFSGNVPLL